MTTKATWISQRISSIPGVHLVGDPHSVHPPPPFCRGVVPPTKFSKRRGLTGPQLLEGVARKQGCDFFQEGGVAVVT